MDNQTLINTLIQDTQSLECTDTTPEPQPHFDKEYTIIAKILSEKPINMNAFKSTILKAWNPKKRVIGNLLETNIMAFVFEDENDQIKILNLSWFFRDLQILVQSWPPDKSLQEIDLNTTTYWIQAYNILVCLINNENATAIGNQIGRFIKTEHQAPGQRWKKFVRVQVQVDILKPLFTISLLPCKDRPNILIEVRYERLSGICYNCGFWVTNFNPAVLY